MRLLTAGFVGALQHVPETLGWIRRHFKIRDLSPAQLIVETIVPPLTAEDTDELLLEAARYIARHGAKLDDSGKKAVKQGLPRLLAGSNTKWDTNTLALPAGLDPETDWQHVFPTKADRAHLVVLSDDYLTKRSREWRRSCERLAQLPGPSRSKRRRFSGAANRVSTRKRGRGVPAIRPAP